MALFFFGHQEGHIVSNATTNTGKAFLPDDYGKLLIATASEQSVALQVTNVVYTDSTEFRIPLVTDEAAAAWYAEGAQIDIDDATLGEELVRPRKVAGLSKISNELASDSSPAAATVIGQSIARSISTKIDAALFGYADGAGVPPKGLGAFADSALSLVTAPAAWADIDPFIAATFAANTAGGNITAFIANPADAEALAKLKRESGSNEPLLAPDANSATRRSIAGVPLWVSTSVPAGTVYGIDRTRLFTVLRNDVTVETDRSAYFSYDSTGLRAVARVGFAYAHAKSVTRIVLEADEWKTATAVTVGTRVELATDEILECTTAGTTDANAPTPPAIGSTVTDGTAVWIRRS